MSAKSAHPHPRPTAGSSGALVCCSSGLHHLEIRDGHDRLAAEFGDQGLASNTLWPRTFIGTSALRIADPAMAQRSRTPQIMADAAYRILTRPSREATGQAYLDEMVLRDAGITDFSGYAVDPAQEPEIDWFVPS